MCSLIFMWQSYILAKSKRGDRLFPVFFLTNKFLKSVVCMCIEAIFTVISFYKNLVQPISINKYNQLNLKPTVTLMELHRSTAQAGKSFNKGIMSHLRKSWHCGRDAKRKSLLLKATRLEEEAAVHLTQIYHQRKHYSSPWTDQTAVTHHQGRHNDW